MGVQHTKTNAGEYNLKINSSFMKVTMCSFSWGIFFIVLQCKLFLIFCPPCLSFSAARGAGMLIKGVTGRFSKQLELEEVIYGLVGVTWVR